MNSSKNPDLNGNSIQSVARITTGASKPQALRPVRRSLSLSNIHQNVQSEKQHSANSDSLTNLNDLASPDISKSTTQKISRMLATPVPREPLNSDKLIEQAKLKIIDSLDSKYKANVTITNFRDVLTSFMDHIVDESQEVLSWTPEAEDAPKGLVGIHYWNDLFASMKRVASESANFGYAPDKVAHLRGNNKNSKITYLDGIERDFSVSKATIYITICYTSEKHLTEKTLKKVIDSYLKKSAAKVIVYLGRSEEINDESKEKSKKQLEEWLSANANLVNSKDERIQVIQRPAWVKDPAYENAKKLFASELIGKKLVMQAIEQDIVGRLVQKGILHQKSSRANNQVEEQQLEHERAGERNALPLSLNDIMSVIKAPNTSVTDAHKLGAFFAGYAGYNRFTAPNQRETRKTTALAKEESKESEVGRYFK